MRRNEALHDALVGEVFALAGDLGKRGGEAVEEVAELESEGKRRNQRSSETSDRTINFLGSPIMRDFLWRCVFERQ
jgi:hypothetical protein